VQPADSTHLPALQRTGWLARAVMGGGWWLQWQAQAVLLRHCCCLLVCCEAMWRRACQRNCDCWQGRVAAAHMPCSN
jgi:hypothetical protein